TRLAVRHKPKDRQIPVVIQEEVEFNGALGLTPASPVKHAGTQLDGGAVEGEQTVFEPEVFPGADGLALGQEVVKEFLEELPGSVRVGIGERGTLGLALQAQVLELALATLEPIGDFP